MPIILSRISLYWFFQVLNGYTSVCMVFFVKSFHETMLANPVRAYQNLGFSPTAVEMLHNIIRGHGCALLAITVFLFKLGSGNNDSYLLIAITCGFTAYAHYCTLHHHLGSTVITNALGNMDALYQMICINIAVMVAATFAYYVGE